MNRSSQFGREPLSKIRTRLGVPAAKAGPHLFVFSVLMGLTQAHPRTAAIPIDEFHAGSFQSAANR